MANDFFIHRLFSFPFIFLITLYKEKPGLSRKGRKFVRQMTQKDAAVRQKRAHVRSFWAFCGHFASVCVKRFFLTTRERRGIIKTDDCRNNFLNEQGLGGSRCGSVTVRFKHHTVVFFIAAPPLRYLRVSDSKSEPCARVARLFVNQQSIQTPVVRKFLKGCGETFLKSFPTKKRK